MKLCLLTVGKPSRSGLGSAVDDYAGRISRFMPFSERHVKTAPSSLSEAEIRQRESAALREAIGEGAWHVVLDERGWQPTSVEFARRLERERDNGRREAVFCIGGAVGHDPAFVDEADLALSLSRLTLPHDLARLVLVEQLYRACTIMAGLPYHKI